MSERKLAEYERTAWHTVDGGDDSDMKGRIQPPIVELGRDGGEIASGGGGPAGALALGRVRPRHSLLFA